MAIRKQLIVATDADRDGIESAIRADKPTFALTKAYYTASDPAPRSITHWCTDFTQSTPLPSIEDPVAGCKVVFTNSLFEDYLIPPQAGYGAARIANLGLTSDPN